MEMKRFSNLNVELTSKFFDEGLCEQFYNGFVDLNFLKSEFNCFGCEIQANRKVSALGDHNGISYTFGWQIIKAEPWTALGVKLQHRIFKYFSQKYNFALLELYDDGNQYFPMHQKNSVGLDPKFDLCLVHFGATRTLQFECPGMLNEDIEMCSGSILKIPYATNLKFKQCILQDSTVTTPSITVLFMKIIQHQPLYKNVAVDWLILDTIEEDRLQSVQTVFAGNWAVILKELHGVFYVDIRGVIHKGGGSFTLSKTGISMSPHDFFALSAEIRCYPQQPIKDSLVNNLILKWVEDKLLVQKLIIDKQGNLILDFKCIKLWPFELMCLCEKLEEIDNAIIHTVWESFLPRTYCKFFDAENVITCDDESIQKFFKFILEQFLLKVVKTINPCTACQVQDGVQEMHMCTQVSIREQYEKIGIYAFALINIELFSKKLAKSRLISLDYIQSTNVLQLHDIVFT